MSDPSNGKTSDHPRKTPGSAADNQVSAAENKGTNPTLIAALVLVILVAAGIWGVLRFVDSEKQRELLLWQDRLGVVADSRVDAVDRWLDSQFAVARALADNTSLQLYLTQLIHINTAPEAASTGTGDALLDSLMGDADDTTPSGTSERVFLRDLLISTADRHGYLEKSQREQIQANVDTKGSAGMALLDNTGQILVATRGFPAMDAETRKAISTVIANDGRGARDLYLDANQQPAMAFFAPIHAVQGDTLLGLVMAVKPVGDELYPLLHQKGLTTETHETLLVRQDGDNVIYLSPQRDGGLPLKRRLNMQPERHAASFALSKPGHFAALKDYSGQEVLAVSRALGQVPWVLVQKINAEEALREAKERGDFLLWGLLLLVGGLSMVLIAAWRHGSSVRYRQVAEQLEETNERMLGQKLMLNSITDNVSDYLAILDSENQFVFANAALAKTLALRPEDFVGKTPSAMFGSHVAEKLEQDLQDGDDHYTELVQELEIGGEVRSYSNLMVALPDAGFLKGTHLLVMRDVTKLLEAEERQERVMWQLVETLSTLLDEHDPYSANHSSRVATVARAIAEEQGLDRGEQTTIRIAASLINLGKLAIPKDILTKQGKLTDKEFAIINSDLEHAADILGRIDFEGPVVESILQSKELLDGSGKPRGLKGDAIILPGRILNVANSFVAMTNPRPWRKALSFEAAIDQLNGDAGSKYDRKVIATLYNLIENRGGSEWADLWNSASTE